MSLKNGMTLLTVVSLYMSTIPIAFANQQDGRNDWVGSFMNISNTVTNVAGQAMNMQAQNAAMMASAAQMQGSTINVIPSDLYADCPVPAKTTSTASGQLCSPPTSDADLSILSQWVGIATKNISTLEAYPGECLVNKKNALDARIQDKLNFIQNQINEINKQSQAYRDQALALKKEIDNTHNELEGNTEAIDSKSKTLADTFNDPACKSVLPAQLLEGSGFRKAKKFFEAPVGGTASLNGYASATKNNKSTIEKHLIAQTDRMKDFIKNYGLDAWLRKSQGGVTEDLSRGLTNFGALNGALKAQNELIVNKYTILKDALAKDLDYELPILDKNFDSKVAALGDPVAMEKNFQKKFIRDCVMMKGKIGSSEGQGLSVDQLLRSLTAKTSGPIQGTTVQDYKNELAKILNSDADMETKMKQIAALGNQDVGMRLNTTYSGRPSNYVYTPYELLDLMSKNCEQKYVTSKNATSGAGSELKSYQDRVRQAITDLTELKAIKSSYVGELSQKLASDIMNCPNAPAPLEGSCGGPETYKVESKNFCYKTAETCSNNINACFAKAANEVKVREDKMKVVASQYNAGVTNMLATQENFLKNVIGNVINDMDMSKFLFKNAKWELPKDLFVAKPKMGKYGETGLELLGEGNIEEFLNGEQSLPKQLAKLQVALKQQGEKMNEILAKHDADIKKNSATEIGKWKDVISKCSSASDGYVKAKQDAYKKQMEDYNKGMQKLSKLCSEANSLRGSSCRAGSAFKRLAADVSKQDLPAPGIKSMTIEAQELCGIEISDGEKNSDSSLLEKVAALNAISNKNSDAKDKKPKAEVPAEEEAKAALDRACQNVDKNTKAQDLAKSMIEENEEALLNAVNRYRIDDKEFEKKDLLNPEQVKKMVKSLKIAGLNGSEQANFLSELNGLYSGKLKDETCDKMQTSLNDLSKKIANEKEAREANDNLEKKCGSERTKEGCTTEDFKTAQNAKKTAEKELQTAKSNAEAAKSVGLQLAIASVRSEAMNDPQLNASIGENASLPECDAFASQSRMSPFNMMGSPMGQQQMPGMMPGMPQGFGR